MYGISPVCAIVGPPNPPKIIVRLDMKEWRIQKIVLGKGGAKGARDAVDTSHDLGGQNVLKTSEAAIRHNRRPTRTELESVFCRWIYFHLRSNILPSVL